MNCSKAAPEAPVVQERGICFRPFDESGAFILAAEGQEVRRLAMQGAGATTLAQAFGLTIQIISTLVLARLLTPADFGLVTMVTTFSLLLMNAGGNGFTEAVLQRKEVNHFLISNLFWINVSIGLVLTIAFAAAGSLMARFYHNPRVAPIALGLSLTILITSTSVLHLALLMRAMRFPVVYANQMFARVVSMAVSILLALAGWGYWALVAGALTQPLSECVGAWNLCRWIPGRPRGVAETGSMVRFYKKAYDLFAMSGVLQSFTPVAVSALSRLSHDSQRYRRHLLSMLSVWAFLGMGVGGCLTLVGKDLIRVLLGPGWEPAGRVFTLFGPGFGIMFLYGIHGWIHLSIGKPGRWFKWSIIEFFVTGSLFIVALPWGPAGVATSWSLSLLILTIPALRYAGKPIDLGTAPVIAAVWKFVAASLVAGCTTALIFGGFRFFDMPSNLVEASVRTATISLLFAILYVSAVILLHQSFAPLYQVTGLAREMMPWGRTSKASPALSQAT